MMLKTAISLSQNKRGWTCLILYRSKIWFTFLKFFSPYFLDQLLCSELCQVAIGALCCYALCWTSPLATGTVATLRLWELVSNHVKTQHFMAFVLVVFLIPLNWTESLFCISGLVLHMLWHRVAASVAVSAVMLQDVTFITSTRVHDVTLMWLEKCPI